MIPGQVIIPAAAVGLGFLSVMAVGFVVVILWAAACWWHDRRHDVGPDALKLLEDLDAHLADFAAATPEVQAGLARLDSAERAKQQEGESA